MLTHRRKDIYVRSDEALDFESPVLPIRISFAVCEYRDLANPKLFA